jgi:hypothetical protein
MADAGYSGTPLPKKLGIKDGSVCAFVGAPGGFAASLALPPAVEVRAKPKGPLDVVVLFTTSRADLTKRFAALAKELSPVGGLWVAWPKKSSGVATDLTEDVLREVCLPTGLVDNKVCAIDATWSGLRFVIRKKDR